VRAGKFRRYHGESWLARLIDLKTNLLNVRDAFYLLIGIFQAVSLLARLKPDVVFIKGGFVGVPLGVAARIRRVPFITHDSDTLPGLANRLIGRWAARQATGMPASFYSYPKAKVRYVGIPVSDNFEPIDEGKQARLKRELGLAETDKVVLITGGSQGAQNLNDLVGETTKSLLARHTDLTIIHQTGQAYRADQSPPRRHPRLVTKEFLPDLHRYSGAADLIIARAGATTIAEFARQGKACIFIPHPQLAGGHQLKNAAALSRAKAAVVLMESDLKKDIHRLEEAVERILSDHHWRRRLEKGMARLAKPDAARDIARLIIEIAYEAV
jgi:UDP-N-acetylglucosamine--N-acetylmuramyl-(pentapeptide) pyrophosphoryl-undecaprenol N-acetylglucosamine transferase